jgi:hypothetical protein
MHAVSNDNDIMYNQCFVNGWPRLINFSIFDHLHPYVILFSCLREMLATYK